MKQLAMVVVVVAAAALMAATRDVRNAYACSGPPPWEAMAEMPVVVEGHVTTVERLPDPEVNREAFRYTMSVSKGHRGASAGEQIVFVDDRLKPGIPSVCGQLQAELVNKRIVAGFENTNGTYRTGPRVAPFVGDALEGPDYVRAVRMAEIATGSNPSGPNLTSLEATVTCGQHAVMVGRRFKPRATYTLTHPGAFVENEAIRITADDGGNFKAPLKGYYGECPDREIWTYVWALEGEVDKFNCCDVPIALARLRIRPDAAAPGPPDTGNGAGPEYDAAIAEVRASFPVAPAVGTGTALAASTRTVPWGDVVLVGILVMAFAGGTVAIVRSSRKR